MSTRIASEDERSGRHRLLAGWEAAKHYKNEQAAAVPGWRILPLVRRGRPLDHEASQWRVSGCGFAGRRSYEQQFSLDADASQKIGQLVHCAEYRDDCGGASGDRRTSRGGGRGGPPPCFVACFLPGWPLFFSPAFTRAAVSA